MQLCRIGIAIFVLISPNMLPNTHFWSANLCFPLVSLSGCALWQFTKKNIESENRFMPEPNPFVDSEMSLCCQKHNETTIPQ